MFWKPKTPPNKVEQAKAAALDTAHYLGDSLSDLKISAIEKLLATKAYLDETAKEATSQARDLAEKETKIAQKAVQRARDAAENEKAELLAAHDNFREKISADHRRAKKEAAAAQAELIRKAEEEKAELEAQLAQAQALAEESAEKALKKAKKNGRAAYEIEANDGEIEVRRVEESGSGTVFIVLGAVVLIGAALAYAFSGTNGRRSRAAIKDRIDQITDQVKETVHSDAASAEDAKTEAKAAVESGESIVDKITEKVGGTVESAGEALAAKIEQVGEAAHQKANDANAVIDAKKDEVVAKIESAGDHETVSDVVDEAEKTVENIEKSVAKKS